MNITINEIKFGGLKVDQGKSVQTQQAIYGPDILVPEQIIPAVTDGTGAIITPEQIILAVLDADGNVVTPEQVIPAVTDGTGAVITPEQIIHSHTVKGEVIGHNIIFRWQYSIELLMIPCKRVDGALFEIDGTSRRILEDMCEYKTIMNYDLELPAGPNNTEPATSTLGMAILQWMGTQLATARAVWDNRTIQLNIG